MSNETGTKCEDAQSARGSVWHRWDPHIHTPQTVLNNQLGNSPEAWDAFARRVSDTRPPIRALGITDYYGIENYIKARAMWLAGKLPEVGLIFPNVELRLYIETPR